MSNSLGPRRANKVAQKNLSKQILRVPFSVCAVMEKLGSTGSRHRNWGGWLGSVTCLSHWEAATVDACSLTLSRGTPAFPSSHSPISIQTPIWSTLLLGAFILFCPFPFLLSSVLCCSWISFKMLAQTTNHCASFTLSHSILGDRSEFLWRRYYLFVSWPNSLCLLSQHPHHTIWSAHSKPQEP